MNDPRDALAAMQIDALRLRLALQRAQIAGRIGASPVDRGFPRSATLRLLLRHPASVARVVVGVFGRGALPPRAALALAAALAITLAARGRRPR